MRTPAKISCLLTAVALVAIFVSGCDEDTVAPEVDPPLPTGTYSGTLYVSFTDHESPAYDHEEFSVEVDSAGTVTISPESMGYNVNFTNDALCDETRSGNINLAPVASIIRKNHNILVAMTLTGPASYSIETACPGQPPSSVSGSATYSNDCTFSWAQVIGNGAYCLIENLNPPPFGVGSEFRLVLRLSPTS